MTVLELFSRFEELLHYALHIRDTQDGQSLPWSEICKHMHFLAEAERVRPLSGTFDPVGAPIGVPLVDNMDEKSRLHTCLQDCRFAIYALVDEILMESPHHDKNSATAWYQNRLQVRFMNTDRAGELFFTKLHALSEDILADIHTDSHISPPLVAHEREQFFLPHAAYTPQASYTQRAAHDPLTTHAEHTPFSAFTFPEQFKSAVSHCLTALSSEAFGKGMYGNIGENFSGSMGKNMQGNMNGHTLIKHINTLTLAIYALCILHGFKGLYYDKNTAQALENIRCTAASLCQRLIPESVHKSETATVMTPAFYSGIYGGLDFWYLAFLLIPLLLSALWYILCADIMGQSLF